MAEHETYEKDAAKAPTKTERLYWVDWARTQSVMNVMFGHAWWTAADQLTPKPFVPGAELQWSPANRMSEYAADVGTLHTVPLFFFIAGYLTSQTANKEQPRAFCSFFLRRLQRLVPPFVAGCIFLAIVNVIIGKDESVLDLVLSHLWFLWALLLVQTACYPFVLFTLNCANGQKSPTVLAMGTVGTLVAFAIYWAACEVLWQMAEKGLVVFNLLPLLGALGSMAASAALPKCPARAWSAAGVFMLATFIMSGTGLYLCGPADCSEFTWLQPNLVFTISTLIMCYMAGFTVQLYWDDFTIPKITGTGFVPVMALLFSAFWPYLTHWGNDSQSSWLDDWPGESVWRAGPIISHTESSQRVWAIARMWFWIGLMLLFAKYYCNTQVSEKFHRHITQSAMIVYIFHRAYERLWFKALDGSVEDGWPLCYTLFWLVWLTCMATYALLVQLKPLRFVFGVETV